MSTLLSELSARNLVHDVTPGFAERLARGPVTGYVGFDPTADSLHVGNLVVVMSLAWLQRLGGRPIALVGGGTGLVGDPSGKRSERPMLDETVVEANAAAIRSQLERFLDFDGPCAARMANNAEWLKTTGLLEFLRDVGKHFSINYMLQKDSVKSRLDSGISFTEFSYMLVQAYDFAHLYQTAQCELQMGGSDQWGNITAGIELIGKRYGGSAHGLVLPLLTTASGAKFGKSESGNVWLDPAKTSPYKFYQFWLNTEDADVERLFKTFTFRPLAEIAEIAAAHARDPGKRTAQRELARDLTIRVHGADTVGRVVAASDFLFGHADLHSLEPGAFDVVAGEVPTAVVERAGLDNLSVVDAFTSVGLASSKADARRNIQGNGFSINGERVTGADQVLGTGQLLAGRWIVLQKGKRNFALLDVR